MRSIFFSKRREGLEGLPLYLIILVIVAGIALVIIMGILQPLEKPNLQSITVSPQTLSISPGGSQKLTVTAFGSNGKALQGVVITISGYGLDKGASTSSGGTAVFTIPYYNSDPSNPTITTMYEIEITAQYTGTTPNMIQSTVIVNDT